MIEEYPKILEMASKPNYLGPFLDVRSKNLLDERIELLRKDLKKRKKRKPLFWKFSILRKNPLTFLKSEVKGYNLQVDISCEFEGIDDNVIKQNVLLRVWSCDQSISYREGIDSIDIKSRLESTDWKRVILRFHFEKKSPGTKIPEPLYHFQVGGNPEEDEICWFPKHIRVPRIPYSPLDLILLCEFVLINFFPEKSAVLRENPQWNSLVRKSQKLFMQPYLDIYNRCLNDEKNTLLGGLVSIANC